MAVKTYNGTIAVPDNQDRPDCMDQHSVENSKKSNNSSGSSSADPWILRSEMYGN